MRIEHEFTLGIPVNQAFDVLVEPANVVPCLPGARLIGDRQPDGTYELEVAVKLGPMRFQYSGTARVTESDPAARRATLVGSARETRGQGSAETTVTMTVSPRDGQAQVQTSADIALSGRAAQMGHGLIETVAAELVGQMARCLEARFGDGASATPQDGPVATAGESVATAPERVPDASRLVARALVAAVRRFFRRVLRRGPGGRQTP
jgi:uncharacterized protein